MFDHKTGYILGDASRFWWLILAAGVFAFISPYITYVPVPEIRIWMVGSAGILIGIGMRLNYYGLQIDASKNRRREYTSIFGIKKGSWEPLPKIDKIKLTSEEVTSWSTPNGISPSFKALGTTYTIGLFNNHKLHIFFQSDEEQEAVSQTNKLAELLHAEVEDLRGA